MTPAFFFRGQRLGGLGAPPNARRRHANANLTVFGFDSVFGLVTSSDALVTSSFLFLVVMPGATSSFLLLVAMHLVTVGVGTVLIRDG